MAEDQKEINERNKRNFFMIEKRFSEIDESIEKMNKKQDKIVSDVKKKIKDKVSKEDLEKELENMEMDQLEIGKKIDELSVEMKKGLRGVFKEELKKVIKNVEDTETKQLDLAMHMDKLSKDIRASIKTEINAALQNTQEMIDRKVESSVKEHLQEMESIQISMLDTARSVKDLASHLEAATRQIQQINSRIEDIGKVKTEDVNAIMREQFEKFTQTMDKTFSHYPTKEEIQATIDSYQRQWSRQEMDTLQSLANAVKRMDEHITDMHGLVTNFSRRLPIVIE